MSTGPSRDADAPVRVHGTPVYGAIIDLQTRCAHYGGPTDVIAIRFACCDRFYPCHDCHEAAADHRGVPWPGDRRDTPAVLCGVCGHVLTISEYLQTDDCPRCAAAFNPGCRLHHHLYFEPADSAEQQDG